MSTSPVSQAPTAPPLPRAPRAWWRLMKFFGAALVELFSLLWLVLAGSLVIVGLGIWLLPSALDLASANADRSRELARRLTGVTIEAHRRPVRGEPGAGQWRYTWQRLQDPVMRRDLTWHVLNPIVGLTLSVLSSGLVLAAAWDLVAIPFQIAFPEFQPATWFTITQVVDLPFVAGLAVAVAAIVLQTLLGIVLARPTLRALGWWTRRVLHEEDSRRWRARASELAASRADALSLEQAEIERIERDLHDGAQMRFVATGLTISEASRLIHDEPDRAVELLKQAKEESAAGLAELRDLVRGIRPPVLADRGLADAVRALAKESAIPTDVTSTITTRLAAPIESALYFAAAETLTNAAKHSGAGAIEVSLADRGEQVHLTISDNGRGGARVVTGGGLDGVRRRLSTFDGTLEIASPAAGPTVVAITAPFIAAATAEDRRDAG